MIGAVEQMQLDRRLGAPHQAERLLVGGDAVAGAVQDEDRARRDFFGKFFRPEHEEAERGVGGELHQRAIRRQVDLQGLRHFENVEAVDHFYGARVRAGVVQQRQKLAPGFRRMHAADHALAVGDAVLDDDRGDALIAGRRLHRHAAAEA